MHCGPQGVVAGHCVRQGHPAQQFLERGHRGTALVGEPGRFTSTASSLQHGLQDIDAPCHGIFTKDWVRKDPDKRDVRRADDSISGSFRRRRASFRGSRSIAASTESR